MLVVNNVYSQHGDGNLRGVLYVRLTANQSIAGIDSSTDGAVVCLMTATDTLYTVSVNSKFTFDKVAIGKARVQVMHLNYEITQQDVDIKNNTECEIQMELKTYHIKDVVVKGEIPLITKIGDTIRFNAAAQRMMEGDVALEILRNMPGVKISESGITINGQAVARTYVNKTQVFGQNVMTALTQIPVADVVSIDTYTEARKISDGLSIIPNNKVRVMNIRTKNPIVQAVSGTLLGSTGVGNGDKIGNKYHLGAVGNFFSEKLLLSCNVFTSTMGFDSNNSRWLTVINNRTVDTKHTYANMSVNKLWTDENNLRQIRFNIGYLFDRKDEINQTAIQNTYFPTEQYSSRESFTRLKQHQLSASHEISPLLEIGNSTSFHMNIGAKMRFSDINSDSRRSTTTQLNDDIRNNVITQSSANDNRYSSYKLNLDYIISRAIKSSVNADYSRIVESGDNIRIDSLHSTPIRTIVGIKPRGIDHNANISGEFVFMQWKDYYLSLLYTYNYEHSVNRMMSVDRMSSNQIKLDSVNTYDYTRNYHSHTGTVQLSRSFKKFYITLMASARWVDIGRNEYFPDITRDNKRQTGVILPGITIERSNNDNNEMKLSYSTDIILPSIEQWRNRLVNTNPLYLTVGNSNLKRSFVHIITFKRSHSNNDKASSIDISANITEHTIADKITYFADKTFLPEYNYTAEPQTQLTTYENMGHTIRLSADYSFGQLIKVIKCVYNLKPSFEYVSTPYYVDDQSSRRNIYSFKFAGLLSSRFSRYISVSINDNVGYILSKNNDDRTDKLFNMGGGVQLKTQFLKYFFFDSQYTFSYYKNLAGSIPTQTSHILNAVAGAKLLKKRLELSVSAIDILNRQNAFSTAYLDNYIANRWNTILSRRFTVNVAWKFYKSKSGLTGPKGAFLHDGSINSQTR